MKYTKNLELKLPESTDPVKVSDLNENFEALDKAAGAYEVGDLRSTLRTDLGDRWLLCNGEAFDPAEYPELAETVPSGMRAMVSKAKTRSLPKPNDASQVSCVASDGVNRVVAFLWPSSGSKVVWSPNNFNSTVTKDMGTSAYAAKVFYANGHWILFAKPDASGGYTKVCTTDAANTDFKLGTTLAEAVSDVFGVEYQGGKYYAWCQQKVLIADNPHFAAVSVVNVGNGISSYGFIRAGSYYVMYGTGTSDGVVKAAIAYSTDPGSGYQTRFLDTPPLAEKAYSIEPFFNVNASYIDGKIFWTSAIGSFSPYYQLLAILYLDDVPTGAVNGFTVSGEYNSGTSRVIVAPTGEYVVLTEEKKYFRVGKSIVGPSAWTTDTLSVIPFCRAIGTQWVAGGYVCTIATNSSGTGCVVLKIPGSALPTVSISNCYTYIKAK